MWWKKYSGYKKPLDKLKQWTEVNKMEFSKVKCEVLLLGLRGRKHTSTASVGAAWEGERAGGPGRWEPPAGPAQAEVQIGRPWPPGPRDPSPAAGPAQGGVGCVPRSSVMAVLGVPVSSRGLWLEEGTQGRGRRPGALQGHQPSRPTRPSLGEETCLSSPAAAGELLQGETGGRLWARSADRHADRSWPSLLQLRSGAASPDGQRLRAVHQGPLGRL